MEKVEGIVKVTGLEIIPNGRKVKVSSDNIFSKLEKGQLVYLDGISFELNDKTNDSINIEIVDEKFSETKFSGITLNSKINFNAKIGERADVDNLVFKKVLNGIGLISRHKNTEGKGFLGIGLPNELHAVVSVNDKIWIDGIELNIEEVELPYLWVHLSNEIYNETTLGKHFLGDKVNVHFERYPG